MALKYALPDPIVHHRIRFDHGVAKALDQHADGRISPREVMNNVLDKMLTEGTIVQDTTKGHMEGFDGLIEHFTVPLQRAHTTRLEDS